MLKIMQFNPNSGVVLLLCCHRAEFTLIRKTHETSKTSLPFRCYRMRKTNWRKYYRTGAMAVEVHGEVLHFIFTQKLLNRHCFGKSERKRRFRLPSRAWPFPLRKRCNLKEPIIAQNIVLVGNLATHLYEINKSKT